MQSGSNEPTVTVCGCRDWKFRVLRYWSYELKMLIAANFGLRGLGIGSSNLDFDSGLVFVVRL